MNSPGSKSRLRLPILLLAAVSAVAVWAQSRRQPPRPEGSSPRDLFAMLEGDEEVAGRAAIELEKRLGNADVNCWQPALHSNSSRARSLAVDALGKSRSPQVERILADSLSDPASSVRLNAVEALASQDPALALRPMLAAVADDDTWVSEQAANKIRDLKMKEAVPALIEALSCPDRETGVFAMSSLKHLTGQSFHASRRDSPARWDATVKKWKEWWATARPSWPVIPGTELVPPVHPTRTYIAPDFRLTDSEGRDLSLSALRGKTVLLNFWGIGCGPCLVEMPGLSSIAGRYRDRGLVVIGVESNGADVTTLRQYRGEHNIGYSLTACNPDILRAYGHIHDVPVSFLIDRDGRIRYEWEGDREERVFDAAVKRVLAQR